MALNARVIYPFWVEKKQNVMELAETTLMRMFSNKDDLDANEDEYRPKVTKFFTASYKKTGQGYFFRPKSTQNPTGFPTIGADPDTKRGDSGAPVFDIQRNSLVGLLRAGVQSHGGGDLPLGANYSFFEIVIPISKIVDELKRKKPTWKNKFGVHFFE